MLDGVVGSGGGRTVDLECAELLIVGVEGVIVEGPEEMTPKLSSVGVVAEAIRGEAIIVWSSGRAEAEEVVRDRFDREGRRNRGDRL